MLAWHGSTYTRSAMMVGWMIYQGPLTVAGAASCRLSGTPTPSQPLPCTGPSAYTEFEAKPGQATARRWAATRAALLGGALAMPSALPSATVVTITITFVRSSLKGTEELLAAAVCKNDCTQGRLGSL
mmetsp:Transcript_26504/g.61625  ORF Transcript_26504/g.61625 Transcript_26504/m.61625 type:complete len:128 (+) Transcript_26504:896-1279(+)